MASYILRRIITIIITLFFISVITFWIMHSVP
ncbi:MAG: peptide ABC transporter permease, partial [Clostridiales bacterium]